MTEQRKNKGGRPRGSGKDDTRDLNEVADFMARNPGVKKTPAIAHVVGSKYPEHRQKSMERRLLRKWNLTGDERLKEAVQRLDEQRRDRVASNSRGVSDFAHLSVGSTESISRSINAATHALSAFDKINVPELSRIHREASLAMGAIDMSAMRSALKSVEPFSMRILREERERMDRMRNLVDPTWRLRDIFGIPD